MVPFLFNRRKNYFWATAAPAFFQPEIPADKCFIFL
jgi:hypothetical protein